MVDINQNTALNSTEEDKIKNVVEPKESKTKKEKTPRNNLIVLTTKPISDKELKEKLNLEFGEHNEYYKILKEAVDNLTERNRKNLRTLMELIRKGINPNFVTKNGKVIEVRFSRTLTDEELDNFVVMIPVEMYFINEYMNDKALDMELAQYLKEFHITEKLLQIKGGTEKERLRAAEYESMIPIFTSIIKNRVYYNLKNEIEAANRVYEALKKVMNSRIEDKKLFGKSERNTP